MPYQSVALIGKGISVQETGILGVTVQNRSVNCDLVMIDPVIRGVKHEAKVGTLVWLVLLQLRVILKEWRHANAHRHVKAFRVPVRRELGQLGQVETAHNKSPFLSRIPAGENQLQLL